MTNYSTPQMFRYQRVHASHWLHFAITLLTLGAWLPVWVIVEMVNANRVRKVYVYSHNSPLQRGWYQDPWHTAAARYYSGSYWTEWTR